MSAKYNSIEFYLAEQSFSGGSPGHGIGIRIDGRDFKDIVRQWELPSAAAEGYPQMAGNYNYRSLYNSMTSIYYFLGRLTEGDECPVKKGMYLLVCNCGMASCDSLSCRVHVKKKSITWHTFRRQVRPDWDYAWHEFRFRRKDYLMAIIELGGLITQQLVKDCEAKKAGILAEFLEYTRQS
ncbi:MAG: hypothetical protein KDK39_14795 [Leptospiraceae bacterium]|nr:hypothetical protein [Leptospiraceae bacterium]